MQVSSNNGQMHHKVIVIDRSVVITDSPIFSKASFDNNDENALIFSCPPLAKIFTGEFERCWQAKPYSWKEWSQRVR